MLAGVSRHEEVRPRLANERGREVLERHRVRSGRVAESEFEPPGPQPPEAYARPSV
jgi:hypothetical protein